MTNYASGHQAEKYAAQNLEAKGYEIVALNWRTRYCEIDIVAKKKKVLYFIEAKYRKNSAQGSGFDYITAKKLEQMQFAARMWVAEHDWQGDYSLGAIEVSGPQFEVTNFLAAI